MRFGDVESCWYFVNSMHDACTMRLMRASHWYVFDVRTSGAKICFYFVSYFVHAKEKPRKTAFSFESHRESFGIYLLMILFGCDVDVFIILSMAKTYEMLGLTLNDYISMKRGKRISCKMFLNFGRFYFNLFFIVTFNAEQKTEIHEKSALLVLMRAFSSCVAMAHELHHERIF